MDRRRGPPAGEADDKHDDADDDQEIDQEPGDLEHHETDDPGDHQQYADGNQTSHDASSSGWRRMLRPNVQSKSGVGYGRAPTSLRNRNHRQHNVRGPIGRVPDSDLPGSDAVALELLRPRLEFTENRG